MNRINLFFAIMIFTSAFPFTFYSQDIKQDIHQVKQFNNSVTELKQTLYRLSTNFYYYNKSDKSSANILIEEILKLSQSLRNPRNEFLYSVYSQLDSFQRESISKVIGDQINLSDPLYNEIVSIYGLRKHYSRILSIIDIQYYNVIESEFLNEDKISDQNILQLKYISSLANLGDERYENQLLSLVDKLYKLAKNENDKIKRELKLVCLFNRILLNSVGKMFSKNSVVHSLYFLDEPSVIQFSQDVADSNLAWDFLQKSILHKLKLVDEKYRNLSEFSNNIEAIKEELKKDDSIWLDHIKTYDH